jgi:hypothetical protein
MGADGGMLVKVLLSSNGVSQDKGLHVGEYYK